MKRIGKMTLYCRALLVAAALYWVLPSVVMGQIVIQSSTKISASSIGANFPQGITYHPDRDTLFVLDDDGKVIEINRQGNVLGSFFDPGVFGGGGIAYDSFSGKLLLGNETRIRQINLDGSSPATWMDLSLIALSIEGVAVDPVTGNIWVADDNTEKILEMSRTGQLIRQFRMRDILPALVEPSGLAFFGANLLVVDDFDGTRKLYLMSTDGQILQTVADLPPLGLSDPEGVVAVGAGEIWLVGDNDNALVRLDLETSSQPLLPLYFAQFGEGEGLLFSQIMLLNPDPSNSADVTVQLRSQDGLPLTLDLNGAVVNGEMQTTVPGGGLKILKTDGLGPIQSGSVTVLSDLRLSGVILFGGSVGVAGVGSSQPMPTGFVAPMEYNTADGTVVGIAIMNLEPRTTLARLELYDPEGLLVAVRADYPVAPLGREAVMLDQLFPESSFPNLDLNSFEGLLKVTADGLVAGMVIQLRPGEYATMPVVPLSQTTTELHFAQIGDGGGLLFSQILLFNLDDQNPADAEVTLLTGQGLPLTGDLNGQVVNGSTSVTIPPGGLRILKTDGVGDIWEGSATVTANRSVAGVILFGGVAGVAGVGRSVPLNKGFLAPMESLLEESVQVGVAIMNLESTALQVDLELFDENGTLVATRQDLPLQPRGRTAEFLETLFPAASYPGLNLSNFRGVLEVTTPGGRISAMVIQTRPGQFATMPVAAIE